MKTIRMSLMISSILVFGISGCSIGASVPQQITAFNVGCETKDVQIFDETVELNSTESWTAKCKGKTYSCTYFPDGNDSGCYELHE